MKKFNKRSTLWNNWNDFRKNKKKWYDTAFKTQNADDIVKAIGKLARENLEMKLKMAKEEVDEVLEKLTEDVKECESHKNLITFPGNKAMEDKHWPKVFEAPDAGRIESASEPITLNVLI